MSEQSTVAQDVEDYPRINRVFGRLCTFMLAATASLIMTMSVYVERLHAPRVGALLLILIALHLVWHSRFLWQREFTLYSCFVGYMFIALMWTRDVELAFNTLVPAINFILVVILFGSLIAYHNIPTVLAGTLCGFVAGAAIYTLTQGFPFSYPKDFSYNAIANMYLFGLFVALACSCLWRSNGFLSIAIAVVIMLHIVATTSIKANLGVALGLLAAGIMYFRHFGRLFRRRVLTLIILASGLGFAIASNEALMDAMNRGAQRISLGVHVLQSRGNIAGYSAFEDRDYWRKVGIEGWKLNPVFGYGTEAFRDDYGITSHSTVIDLLYNFGLIGLILFYGVFASLIWRLLPIAARRLSGQRSLIFGGIVGYGFVSLSGTLHYNIFLAAFIGICVALLTFHGGATTSAVVSSNQKIDRQ
jgi:O-antigen ligase